MVEIDFSGFRKYMRKELVKAMRPVRALARASVPVLNAPIRRKGKIYRIPGVVQRAITIRNSKNASARGDIGVFVNVKPLPGNRYKRIGSKLITDKKGQARVVGDYAMVRKSLRSSKKDNFVNPLDPFYWKFLEIGVQKHNRARSGTVSPRPFLKKAGAAMPQATQSAHEAINRYFEGKR
jgi:hypothetical protein